MALRFCALDALGISSIQTERGKDATISGSVGSGGANRRADVITIQMLLNRSALLTSIPPTLLDVDGLVGPKTIGAITAFQKAKFNTADGRVDPGHRTLAALNSVTPVAPAPPPPPPPAPASPTKLALDCVPLASVWSVSATIHISDLISGLFTSGNQVTDPSTFTIINTHFHLDRDPNNLLTNLRKLFTVFTKINMVLSKASSFFRDGPTLPKFNTADAPVGGINFPGTDFFFITFRPGYVGFGEKCRTAMVVHECAHFVGGVGEIGHFAMEFPVPNGAPQDGSTHNYADMTTSEAMRNASSYAAFSIHAATGIDSRFGAGSPNV